MTTSLIPPDMPATLAAMGLKLGRVLETEVWSLCPMHEERTGAVDSKPTNFSVNRITGDFYCFACQYKGALATLVQDVLGLNMWEANGWLVDHGANLTDIVAAVQERVALAATKAAKRYSTSETAAMPEDTDLDYVLFKDPPEDALEDRGISLEAALRYKIKWDNGWLLPFHGPNGRVVGWQVKTADRVWNSPKGIKSADYLFGSAVVAKGSQVVVVESPLDCAVMHTAGVPNVVSTFGAKLTYVQARILLGVSRDIVLAYDNDNAGRLATDMAIRVIGGRANLHVVKYTGKLKEVKDPGDLNEHGIRTLLSTITPAALRGI